MILMSRSRSILDGYLNPLVFWYQWEYLLSSKFAGYLRLAMMLANIPAPWSIWIIWARCSSTSASGGAESGIRTGCGRGVPTKELGLVNLGMKK